MGEASYHTSLLDKMRYVMYVRARALVAGGGLFGGDGGRSCVLKVTASAAAATTTTLYTARQVSQPIPPRVKTGLPEAGR